MYVSDFRNSANFEFTCLTKISFYDYIVVRSFLFAKLVITDGYSDVDMKEVDY